MSRQFLVLNNITNKYMIKKYYLIKNILQISSHNWCHLLYEYILNTIL